MAKGLPYFKFTPTEWLTGDICLEPFDVQGLFINICALYWQRDGNLSIDDIEKRYKKPTALHSLTDRFLSVNNGLVSIAFLDEQLTERKHISKVNSENGSKGGRPKTLEEKPTANRPLSEKNPIRRRRRKEEEKEEEQNNIDVPSELSGVWKDFLAMRKSIRKPATERAQKIILKKLKQLSENKINIAIEILNQSIVNSWQDIYPLKKKENDTGKSIIEADIDTARRVIEQLG